MTAVSILLTLALQAASRDTAPVRLVESAPADAGSSAAALGEPALRLGTGQGAASIWLLRTRDSAFVVARIPDSTYYWGDDLVISLDVSGDRGTVPGHDDFQWYFRRSLDSSVVYRGRGGRWEAPRGDPDWRLGPSREGGGWTVNSRSEAAGWSLVLRLDAAWLEGEAGRRPGVAFQIYDDSPSGWFAWPAPEPGRQPVSVERMPDAWATLYSSGP
ncbi:MAG TPA: hypothetical protein VM094_03465 [Gemmatimonadales bacterium]|nr:hypothetical protein [Gemmatimonadales bacterium]